MTSIARIAAATCVVAGSLLAGPSCREPLDTDRETVDKGTFGETLTTLACKRMAYLNDLADGGKVDVRGDTYRAFCREGLAAPNEAPDDLKALAARRADLVEAIDAMFPEAYLPELQTFLTRNEFLALYDGEGAESVTQHAIDALIGLLEMLAADDEATAALERLNVRLGYRPQTPALGAVRAVVNYPELHDLLLVFGEAVSKGGSARGEWENLIEAAGATLRDAEPSETPDAPDRVGVIALDLLLRERAELGTSRPIPVARRDLRGVATLAAVAEPFVDGDGDGLADTDELGRYVDATGAVLAVPSPFTLPDGEEAVPWPQRDAEGRPLVATDGPLLYQYVDLDRTVMTALARDGVKLFDPGKGTALDLLRGSSALMGPRVVANATYASGETLEYRGYDTTESALLDMLYGVLGVLRDPNIEDTLELARVLITDHEPEVARLAEAVVKTARFGDAHPEAIIPAGAPLWDDMMPVVREILRRPALVTALMKALEAPEVAQLGERFRKYMTYKDRWDIESDGTLTSSFTTPVNRAAVDSAFERSLFQRLLHLINDSSGARLCNKDNAKVKVGPISYPIFGDGFDECALVQIDDLAIFYLQSIVFAKDGSGRVICENNGGSVVNCGDSGARPRPKANMVFKDGVVSGAIDVFGDNFLEDQSGIDGFRRHPTPPALHRVMFQDPMPDFLTTVLNDVEDKDGDVYKQQHAGTLPVWEAEGFYDQIRPILQAFADNNAEGLFIDALKVFHKHWPTKDSITHQTRDPDASGYVWGSGARTWEPLLVDVLADNSLLEALVGVAPTLNAVTVRGKTYPTIARNAATYLLTPKDGLADRQGRTESVTADGRAVTTLSPWNVLADAYALKQIRLAAAQAEGEAWSDSIREVMDVLVRGDEVPTVGWKFRNPRFRGVSLALIELVRSRLQAHDAAGDRDAWLSTELPADLHDLLTDPLFAGAADFILSLQAAPETRQQLESMMAYMVDEVAHAETFTTSMTSVGNLLQLTLSDADIVPLAHVAGEAIRPELGWLDAQLDFLTKARRTDADRALVKLLQQGYREHRPGRTPIGDIIDTITEIKRANPYTDIGKRYSAEDFRSMFTGMAFFFDDEKRGLRKFIDIVKGRNL